VYSTALGIGQRLPSKETPMTHWPHAPIHKLDANGAFMVTAGTCQKEHFFRDPARLDSLHGLILDRFHAAGWQLQAWAVFSNHYHFVGITTGDPETLSGVLQQLHYDSAVYVNALDGVPGRPVWFNFWDTHLTYPRSYYARLNYVHYNPVRHGLASNAVLYKWCSAAWFERTASNSFVQSVKRFKTDRLTVIDDF
jgi:putative transposase